GSELVAAYGPYFTDRYDTFWGEALDYTQPAVREWAIQNAEQWIRDYRIDGLRLDAVHAVFDRSRKHVLTELAERVRAIRPARSARSSSPRTGRTSPTATTGSGARRSTTRSPPCASGRSRTPSSGSATTASTGCASTPSTPSSTAAASTS